MPRGQSGRAGKESPNTGKVPQKVGPEAQSERGTAEKSCKYEKWHLLLDPDRVRHENAAGVFLLFQFVFCAGRKPSLQRHLDLHTHTHNHPSDRPALLPRNPWSVGYTHTGFAPEVAATSRNTWAPVRTDHLLPSTGSPQPSCVRWCGGVSPQQAASAPSGLHPGCGRTSLLRRLMSRGDGNLCSKRPQRRRACTWLWTNSSRLVVSVFFP